MRQSMFHNFLVYKQSSRHVLNRSSLQYKMLSIMLPNPWIFFGINQETLVKIYIDIYIYFLDPSMRRTWLDRFACCNCSLLFWLHLKDRLYNQCFHFHVQHILTDMVGYVCCSAIIPDETSSASSRQIYPHCFDMPFNFTWDHLY